MGAAGGMPHVKVLPTVVIDTLIRDLLDYPHVDIYPPVRHRFGDLAYLFDVFSELHAKSVHWCRPYGLGR
jgi:hypothetical protein